MEALLDKQAKETSVEKLNTAVAELVKRGEAINVNDPQECLQAKQFEVECKSYEKAVDLYADGDIAEVKERLSKLQTAKKMLLLPMNAILEVVRAKRRAWEEMERKAAEKEAVRMEKKSGQRVEVKPNIPCMQGVRSVREWKFRITNAKKIPPKYLVPDEQAIGRMVREAKDKVKAEKDCPGIEVWSE